MHDNQKRKLYRNKTQDPPQMILTFLCESHMNTFQWKPKIVKIERTGKSNLNIHPKCCANFRYVKRKTKEREEKKNEKISAIDVIIIVIVIVWGDEKDEFDENLFDGKFVFFF